MGIDKTYIISLSERFEDRLIPLMKHMEEYNWEYSVFKATKMQDGKLGLIISVADLLRQLIADESVDTALICEDDFRFMMSPNEVIGKVLKQLPNDFDLCYLGCNLWQTEVEKYSDNLIKLSDAYALHSVIYSKVGMKKVLKAIHEMSNIIPLDVLIKDKVLPDGKSFCSIPILTTQIAGKSDIEGKIKNWSKVLEKRFEERTKHLI